VRRNAVKKNVVIVSRGSFNNLFQVSMLVRALAASTDNAVRVFFRDESVLKVTKARVNDLNFSEGGWGREGEILARLREADFTDLHSFMRDSKEHGDDVKFFACTSSMYMYGVKEEELVPEIDGLRTLLEFLQEEMSDAERVFTF